MRYNGGQACPTVPDAPTTVPATTAPCPTVPAPTQCPVTTCPAAPATTACPVTTVHILWPVPRHSMHVATFSDYGTVSRPKRVLLYNTASCCNVSDTELGFCTNSARIQGLPTGNDVCNGCRPPPHPLAAPLCMHPSRCHITTLLATVCVCLKGAARLLAAILECVRMHQILAIVYAWPR